MKIIKKTDDGYTVEMSRHELAITLGFDATWKENDTIVLTGLLADYHKLCKTIEQLAGIIKLEKRS